jgi:predicted ribosomally synthesized peptide with SipW-like signal peptide
MAMKGALSVAGIGLVGVGAHATWTSSASATQTVNAGRLDVAISSPTAPGCTDATFNCQSLTLPAVGPTGVGSTFDSTPVVVTLTNNGSVPAYYDTVSFTTTNNNSTFASEVGLCDLSLGADGHYLGNDSFGLVSANNLNGNIAGSGAWYVIQPGAVDTFSLEWFAGAVTTACGASLVPSLTQDAQGGSLTGTLTYTFTG